MKLEFTEDDLKGAGNYLTEGRHIVRITEIETTKSKSGNDMAVVTFADKEGRETREYFPFSANARWKLASLALACGVYRRPTCQRGNRNTKRLCQQTTRTPHRKCRS